MAKPTSDSSKRMPWHRIFGLVCYDVFTPFGWNVNIEHDLSVAQQLLDVLVVHGDAKELPDPLPDGLDNLSRHNLITFKSHREPLDDWALQELTGHYVNYRKQISPSNDALLAEENFRLYGVCCREPVKLRRIYALTPIQQGVYETSRGSNVFRIIVTSQVPKVDRNYLWHLFSAQQERVSQGAKAYKAQGVKASTIVNRLFEYYQEENVPMPYTIEDFNREIAEEFVHLLPPEKRLKGMPLEERLKGVSLEERLKGVSLEERLNGLTAEELAQLLKAIQQKTPPSDQTSEKA